MRIRFTDSLRERSPAPSCDRFCDDERERFIIGTTADAVATTGGPEATTAAIECRMPVDDVVAVDEGVEDAVADGVRNGVKSRRPVWESDVDGVADIGAGAVAAARSGDAPSNLSPTG